jgi:succinate dehydrogenase / fumarate reductase cytochrome b subunit
MAVSILHRVTGGALATVGLALLTWWLTALAGGAESYARFTKVATHPVGLVVLIGLTWAFFQKLFGGVRHLVLDSGAGFELNTNKLYSMVVLVLPVLLTAALWFYLLGVAK